DRRVERHVHLHRPPNRGTGPAPRHAQSPEGRRLRTAADGPEPPGRVPSWFIGDLCRPTRPGQAPGDAVRRPPSLLSRPDLTAPRAAMTHREQPETPGGDILEHAPGRWSPSHLAGLPRWLLAAAAAALLAGGGAALVVGQGGQGRPNAGRLTAPVA